MNYVWTNKRSLKSILLGNISYLVRKVRYVRIKEAPLLPFFLFFFFFFFKATHKAYQNPDSDLQKNCDPGPLEKVDAISKFTRKVKNLILINSRVLISNMTEDFSNSSLKILKEGNFGPITWKFDKFKIDGFKYDKLFSNSNPKLTPNKTILASNFIFFLFLFFCCFFCFVFVFVSFGFFLV